MEASGPWSVAHETEVAMEMAALVHSPSQPMLHVPLGGVREVDVTKPLKAQVESPSRSFAATTEG